MRKTIKNTLALMLGLGIALILAEIVLRIYNPFKTRIRGNEIELPCNLKYEFHHIHVHGLDSDIVHTKNSMGFRGPELPKDTRIKKIFCVGGSTTECFYLTDGHDWPAMLMKEFTHAGKQYWVNNAGLDGHSTMGHIVLLRDHLIKFKPDYVIFLVGCNDVAASGFNKYENYNLVGKRRFLQHFELFNLYLNWRMSHNAAKAGMGHTPVDFVHWASADTSGWENEITRISRNDEVKNHLQGYWNRLDTLAKICTTHGIVPVFVTQPTMLSNAVDPVTGRYLGNLLFQEKSALHYKVMLNAYNDELVRFCKQRDFALVDAANLMESSSNNYYDFFHYTNKGAEKMAKIVYENWGKYQKN